jgi:hypothetical protein
MKIQKRARNYIGKKSTIISDNLLVNKHDI